MLRPAAAVLHVLALLACSDDDDRLPDGASAAASSGSGGGASSSSTGAGGTVEPPYVSGTGDLKVSWSNGLSCTGVYAAGLHELSLAASGDVLVGGTVDGTCSLFGAAQVETGGYDVVAARLAATDGAAMWTLRAGDDGWQNPSATAGGPGGLWLGGSFEGSLDVGGGVSLEATGPDTFSAFLVRLGEDGGAAWGRSFPVDGTFLVSALDSNAAGELLLGGWPLSDVDLGGGPLGVTLGSIVVAELDGSGGHLHSKAFSPLNGYDVTTVHDVALDDEGNAFVVGAFHGTLEWDDGAVISTDAPALFFAALDAAGAHVHSRRLEADGESCRAQVRAVGSGAAVVGTVCEGAVDLGGGPHGNANEGAGHLARFDAGGAIDWARTLGSPGLERMAFAVAPDGDLVVAGAFRERADTGDAMHESAGRLDAILARLDGATGETKSSQRFGDEWDQDLDGVTAGANGAVFVIGSGIEPVPGATGFPVITRLDP